MGFCNTGIKHFLSPFLCILQKFAPKMMSILQLYISLLFVANYPGPTDNGDEVRTQNASINVTQVVTVSTYLP
jgi:hypothetical protein